MDEYADYSDVVSHSPDGTSFVDTAEGFLPRDQPSKTAFYDYASEKSLSHAEAKLFYQQHQKEQGQHTPVDNSSPTISGLSSSADLTSGHGLGPNSGFSPDYEIARSLGPRELDAEEIPKANSTANNIARTTSVHTEAEADPYPLPMATDDPYLADGHVISDANVVSELGLIYTNIQKILNIRHRYIGLSLQRFGDNPKDDPCWNIYPPPPKPVWDDEKRDQFEMKSASESLRNRKAGAADQNSSRDRKQPSTSSAGSEHKTQHMPFPSTQCRKAGHDIGEDFDMADLLPLPEESGIIFTLDKNGVYQVYQSSSSAGTETPLLSIPTIRDFYIDLETILSISSDGPTKSFAFRRLKFLEGKFNLYFLLHEYQETADTKKVPHRDFYNVRKVDTHVHHSSCMNQKHLLRFIKSKMKKSPDEIVLYRDGRNLTLREVFESVNLSAYDLSIDTLDMHASSFQNYGCDNSYADS